MPGQISNFKKSFAKIEPWLIAPMTLWDSFSRTNNLATVSNAISNATGPLSAFTSIGGALTSIPEMTYYGNKLDTDTDMRDKIVDGIHMGTAAIGTIPVVGGIAKDKYC
jgi:hypothetical protein